MYGQNRESLASLWLGGQPVSMLAQWRCLQSNLSSCRDVLGMSIGPAFEPGLHCCSAWKPTPFATDSHRGTGRALQSLHNVPRKAEEYFHWSQGSLASTWRNRVDLKMSQQSKCITKLHCTWDHIHPSFNCPAA